ncbi:FAD-dependent oxidoreductase [Aliivibrio sp. EL58]|uniref:flavin monoamine oxidase family protein n=1 Tax=Aliivibrio sp. EL58 TaxID=2107582 RepID=UPI000EFDB128|nr:FAD-dependent oxidoreductase [Aliivibrio sp. EL58]
MKTKHLIVGAGLSGLYTAYRLEKMGKDYLLLDARERVGGRILSSSITGLELPTSPLNTVDMGPSWFWPQMHPRITQLIDDLMLPIFPQYSQGAYLLENQSNSAPIRYESGFEQSPTSMRIAGGMQCLVDTLLAALPSHKVQLSRKVTHVEYHEKNQSTVTINHNNKQESIEAEQVIFALPLRLLAESISFTPALPYELTQRFSATTTWMAAHAKFFAIYESPFWREEGLSGSASSRVGPLVEIHDASTFEGVGALFGFVGIDAATRAKAGEALIKQAAIEQLTRIFGSKASTPIDIKLLDWSQETLTATEADHQAPSTHPHYGLPASAKALNKFHWYFAGTEAAQENGGYLEGALEAADVVLSSLSNS